jgi:DNA primase
LRERGFGDEILQRFEVGFAPRDSTWLAEQLELGGVTAELAQRTGLLRAKEGQAPFAYFRSRIIFPIKNIAQRVAGFGGRVLGQGDPKYLNSPESVYFTKGKLLYGFAASRISIARLKTAILVEGYLDLLAMAQAGFANVVATCGTAFTEQQAGLLRRGSRTVIILFDADRAGLRSAIRASHVALAAGLEPKVARLSAGEDPASFLQARDRGQMEEVLAAALGYLPLLHALVQKRGGERQAKERALRQALRSIALVPDPIRQEYLLQEASQLFAIGVGILRDHLQRQESAARVRRQRQGERTAGEKAVPPAPEETDQGERWRSFADINRPAIEATLLAHVLKDGSGAAAGMLLQAQAGHLLATPEASQLHAELQQWLESRQSGRDSSPASFVQDRWHDKSESYRRYVSRLLTQEVVPNQTDFERVVTDCLKRLQQGRQREQT